MQMLFLMMSLLFDHLFVQFKISCESSKQGSPSTTRSLYVQLVKGLGTLSTTPGKIALNFLAMSHSKYMEEQI